MTEASIEQPLPRTEERAPNLSSLPLGERLREIYELELSAFEAPTAARLANDGERPNVTELCDSEDKLTSPQFDIAGLRAKYTEQALNSACNASWWDMLSANLESHGVAPKQAQNLHLNSKHTANILVNGRKTTQGFEVFDFGETEQDSETLETVVNTLGLIDQFSGGLLSADPRRPRIALMDGFRMSDNGSGGETLGFAPDRIVAINMSAIAEEAQAIGANRHELLAVVLVHEILGHTLERLVAEDIGRYFVDHFDYSDERVKGKVVESMHASITAKQAAGQGSKPVREKGRVSASEDFATSVDSLVSDTMGWTDTTDKASRHKSKVDTYRGDLVMELMDIAAQQVINHDGTPGFVGSELRYDTDEQGKITISPVRSIEIETTPGEQAVTEEIQKVIEKYKPPKELLVNRMVSIY